MSQQTDHSCMIGCIVAGIILLGLGGWGVVSCNNYNAAHPYVEPTHTWKDLGTTVSMKNDWEPSLLHNGQETITTTKGSFITKSDMPNPFIVGDKVLIRDDACYAKVGDQVLRLIPRD